MNVIRFPVRQPPVSQKEKKSEMLSVRLAPGIKTHRRMEYSTMEILRTLAKSKGMTVSAFWRLLFMTALERRRQH